MEKFMYENDYVVSTRTMAVGPAFEMDGQSKVYERNEDVLVVKDSAMDIISEGCLLGGASYEGRKDAVRYRTGVKRKVPVPMNVFQKIGAMPTHSPRLHNCFWLFPYHIKTIASHPKNHLHSEITFLDGQQLHIDVSAYSLRLQKMRAWEAFSIFFSPSS